MLYGPWPGRVEEGSSDEEGSPDTYRWFANGLVEPESSRRVRFAPPATRSQRKAHTRSVEKTQCAGEVVSFVTTHAGQTGGSTEAREWINVRCALLSQLD